MKPCVYYFEIRGRGEPIKLALAAKGIEFDVEAVNYQEMKSDLTKYQFGQCPRYVDEDGDVTQSNAIMRHIGRKHDLYGDGLGEAAAIDMLMDGVEALKVKYLALIYQDQLAEDKKAAYWAAHCDPATATGARNGGAHFFYLSKLVARYGRGWAVGDKLSVGDALLFDIVDVHVRIFGDEFKTAYPDLLAHSDKFAAIPGVAKYLESPLRLPKVNNNGLG